MNKSFDELTKVERSLAIIRAKNLLITHLYEGVIEIDMPNEKLKSDFEYRVKYARQCNSVNTLVNLIALHPEIRKEVDKISIAVAEGSWYSGSGSEIV